MKMSFVDKKEVEVKYLKVSATIRRWGGAIINGDTSQNGDNVPFKNNTEWCPVIDIEKGNILDWPIGTEASFHFKVCDAGNYWLLDEDHREVAEITDNYVPNGLCHGDVGYGDYIIFNVNKDGSIINYSNEIDPGDWEEDE